MTEQDMPAAPAAGGVEVEPALTAVTPDGYNLVRNPRWTTRPVRVPTKVLSGREGQRKE